MHRAARLFSHLNVAGTASNDISVVACAGSASPKPKTVHKRADFCYFLPIQTRWTDNDIYGHANNAIYYLWTDSVVNEYLIRNCGLDIHKGDVVGFVASSACDYYAPVAFPSVIDSGLRVAKIGKSSVTYEVGIFESKSDTCAALASFTHVFVVKATGRPCSALPDALRAGLEKLLRKPAAGSSGAVSRENS